MKSTLVAFLLLISQLTIAQIPQPGKDTYVNDYAGVLTPTQIANLNQNIADLEKLHQVQLAVVLIDKVPAEYTIKQFAVQIGQQWHIGKDERGMVYVAAIGQRKQSIQVGDGLSDIFTAEQSQEMLKALKSSFKSKDYKGGLDILIDDINNAVPVAESTQPASDSQPQQVAYAGTLNNDLFTKGVYTIMGFAVVVFIVIVTLIIVFSIRNRNRRIVVLNPRNPMNKFGYYDAPGNVNNPYNHPGYYQQPDGTLRDIATGVIVGTAAAYVADSLMNDDNVQQFNDNDNTGFNDNVSNDSFADNNSFDNDSSALRNDTSNWGDWGGSSDSSGDSGFSDSSNSGGSSDW